MLGHVLASARERGLGVVTTLPQVKFLNVLHPDTGFTVEIGEPGTSGRRAFRVLSAEGPTPRVYCSGQLICEPAS